MPPGFEQATPEEQEAYKEVIIGASKLLYSGKSHEAIMKSLEAGSKKPGKTMADQAMSVLGALDAKSDGKINVTVIPAAAAQILELIAELAKDSGLIDVDENILGSAGQYLLKALAEQYGVEPEELQELMNSIPPEIQAKMREQQHGYGKAEEASEGYEPPVTPTQPAQQAQPQPGIAASARQVA